MKVELAQFNKNSVPEDFTTCRIKLADKILKYVEPMVDEKIKEKKNDLIEGKRTQKKLKLYILKLQKNSKKILIELNKQKKISELLGLVDVLVKSGIVYGQSKRNIISLLERINNLPLPKINKAIKTITLMNQSKEDFV